MSAQWFIGAKDAYGNVVIAETVEALDFEDARAALIVRMLTEKETHGELVPTAVSEFPYAADSVPRQFAEAAR